MDTITPETIQMALDGTQPPLGHPLTASELGARLAPHRRGRYPGRAFTRQAISLYKRDPAQQSPDFIAAFRSWTAAGGAGTTPAAPPANPSTSVKKPSRRSAANMPRNSAMQAAKIVIQDAVTQCQITWWLSAQDMREVLISCAADLAVAEMRNIIAAETVMPAQAGIQERLGMPG